MHSPYTLGGFNVPKKPWALWLCLITAAAGCATVIMWFLDSKRALLDPDRLIIVATWAVGWIFGFLENFVRRTFLTEEGVEYRDWFGRTQFFPFSKLSVQTWEGDSIVLTDGSRKIKLHKLDLKFPQAPDLIRRKIPKQLSAYPGW